MDDTAGVEEFSEAGPFRSLLVFSSFKVVTGSLLSPFEVSKILIQSQYVPLEVELRDDNGEEAEKERARARESELVNHEAVYLKDQTHLHPTTLTIVTGQWHALNLLWKTHGFFALWTGNLLDISHQLSGMIIQPMVESTLNDTFHLDDETPLELLDTVVPNLLTNMASHVFCSALLTPLQLIRTRKVIQKRATKSATKYRGFLDSCQTVVREEGFRSLFIGLVPNVLQTLCARVMRTAVPLFIERTFGVDPDGFLFVFFELILSNLELIFTLPLETIRHRLQSQTNARAVDSPFERIIETSRIPYTGLIDCLQRVIEEEGFLALYRGWLPHVISNVMLSILTVVSSIQIDVEDSDVEDM